MNRMWLLTGFVVASLTLFFTCSKDKSTEPNNPTVPVLTTAAVGAITQTTTQCGGTITSDGGTSVYYRGVCWSTDSLPTYADMKTYDGTGTGTFTSSITGLTAMTHYYVRAYAMNDAGLGYGNVDSFITAEEPTTGTVTDIDGNIYATIKIGLQWWMAENLKVTHYRNGDTIANVTDSSAWWVLTSGAYGNYNNDTAQVVIYGRLYNGYAAEDSRNIAPAGWHVPTDAEWQTLVDYLGGEAAAGGKMKEAGTTHWHSPNTGATNESGFSALPGGYRSSDGIYYSMGYEAVFWSSTEDSSGGAWYRYAGFSDSEFRRSNNYLKGGFSVRCVKD